MKQLVFLLEEPSARYMLEGFIKQRVPEDVEVRYIVFSGKQDMEKNLKQKIRLWCESDSRFIILRDKDSGDCSVIKTRLLELAHQSGKGDACLVRIACHELESFFLGDLQAVAEALQMPDLAGKQKKSKYRAPDNLANAAEELTKLTRNEYSKIAGSRAIGPCLRLDGSNRSHSFGVLLEAIDRHVSSLMRT